MSKNPTYEELEQRIQVLEKVELELKRVKEKLRNSERNLDKSQELAHIGNWNWNFFTNEIQWSEEVYRIFGLDPEHFQPQIDSVMNRFHPDDQFQHKKLIAHALENREPFSFEARIFRLDKTVRYVVSTAQGQYNEEGKLTRLIGVVHDITDRKKSGDRLATAHKMFLTVLDSIDATIYVADMETYEILFMNKHMIDSFGRDMTGEICWDVFRGESGPCSYCSNDTLVDENGTLKDVHIWQDQNPITQKWYINYDRAIEWIDGRLVRIQIATDITKLKSMEERLHQSQKMESIGNLAGGVAHDFNNILSIIVGNTELALDDVPEWNPAHSNLKEIKTATLRATKIVKQLLSFSRKTDQELQPIEITLVIKDALKFLRSTIPTTIDILQNIQATDETILADPTQIHQIMMNLFINASQAMEQTGGSLKVNLEKVILDENSAKNYPDLSMGNYVKVIVSDTGPGIAPELIDRIFDPYFTTKEVGKGSGMGLAVVHGIVKSHQGAIAVDSKPGRGTTFSILLPITTEKPEIEKDTNDELLLGSETVLFVDDEKSIVEVVQMMLEVLGYKVTTAMAPQEALDQFSADPSHFDLVITDMTMPNMTGAMLSEKIIEIRPDIPVIICTGNSSLIDEEGAQQLGIGAYVMKPIDMEEIAKTIRKVLDESRSTAHD